jgi:hypothetical protein
MIICVCNKKTADEETISSSAVFVLIDKLGSAAIIPSYTNGIDNRFSSRVNR